MKRIEFGEIRIGETAKRHIQNCLDTNWVSMGPKTQELEQRFAVLMGTKYAVATSSGTSSLVAMTLALPEIAKRPVIPGKSKVICPALAFIANSTGIVSGGLIPKWVDINPKTLNIDPEKVEEAIDDDVVAIYAVGTMGLPADMPKLKEIADNYNLVLFEDACENYGGKVNGKFSHEYAVAGCSSFFQAHLIQAGEGSCVYTNDQKLCSLIESIRSHGRAPGSAYFNHKRFGSNFKTTDLCSSLALEGVDLFHENIKIRKRVWRRLVDFCRPYTATAWFSNEPEGYEVMPHGFTITIKPSSYKKIDELKNILDKYNIHWKRNFGFCGAHDALCRYLDDGDYNNAIWCGNNGLHIGTHAYITDNDIDRIQTALREFFEGS